MGKVKKTPPVKFVVGFIYSDQKILQKSKVFLERKFGRIDFCSQPIAFNFTDYYEKEFGKNLTREFIAFKKLILPVRLPVIKTLTNKIEEKFSHQGKRLINIDPGYLDLAKLVLATTKDFRHRVYLDKGIFAEITLSYQGKSFTPWELTYPDYRSKEYLEVFNRIRGLYNQQIK